MLKIGDVKGVIFDFDDTILDNHPLDGPVGGLHSRSRLIAVHEVGRRHNSAALQALTAQDAADAFTNAKVHSLHGAVWQMLFMAGEVSSENIDLDHPLLNEIVELKDQIHEEVLRTQAKPLPGVIEFIKALAAHGLGDKLAIASTAYRRDIRVFFEISGLDQIFPEHMIFSREQFTHPKPHPEVYEMAFKALGLKSKTGVLAFEDDPRGVMSAKAADLYICAITVRHDRKHWAGLAVPPDAVADSFSEFAHLMDLSV